MPFDKAATDSDPEWTTVTQIRYKRMYVTIKALALYL